MQLEQPQHGRASLVTITMGVFLTQYIIHIVSRSRDRWRRVIVRTAQRTGAYCKDVHCCAGRSNLAGGLIRPRRSRGWGNSSIARQSSGTWRISTPESIVEFFSFGGREEADPVSKDEAYKALIERTSRCYMLNITTWFFVDGINLIILVKKQNHVHWEHHWYDHPNILSDENGRSSDFNPDHTL